MKLSNRAAANAIVTGIAAAVVAIAGACSDGASNADAVPRPVTIGNAPAASGGNTALGSAGSAGQASGNGGSGGKAMLAPPAKPMLGQSGAGGSGMPMQMMPVAMADAGPAGPDDGDPSKPIAVVPDFACKAAGGGGFGLGTANFKVDDRDVIISYPCDKHEGAPVTFILNLHGTSDPGTHFYQEGYFSASKYVGANNLIVATPSAVGTQWGNDDGGKDLPYLMDVIDWVYTNLGAKFDIRSMWVGGHSWGAFYTADFGCKPELADKVRGLIIMSGSPAMPACASKMSVIDTNAEMDIAAPLEQGNVPMQHGCKAATMAMLGNNTQTLWPDCDAGFVHSNYLMLGKMHVDFIDDVVVKDIVDRITAVRP